MPVVVEGWRKRGGRRRERSAGPRRRPRRGAVRRWRRRSEVREARRGNAKPRAAGSGSASRLSLAIALVRRAKVGINGRRTLLATGKRGREERVGTGMLDSRGPRPAARWWGNPATRSHKLGTKRGEIELAHRCTTPPLAAHHRTAMLGSDTTLRSLLPRC